VLEVGAEFGVAVEVEPGFVEKGVVGDFVSGVGDGAQGGVVFFEGGVFADDEEGDGEIQLGEEAEDAWGDEVEVGGEVLPAVDALGLEVGPLVIEIEGDAGWGHF
jgi:hypothetical protein